MLKSRLSMLALMGLVAVTGCSGNSSSSVSNVQPQKVGGYVGAANIAGANVQAVPISNQGQPETEVNANNELVLRGRSTTSTSLGSFRATIDGERIGYPTVVIVTSPEGKATMRCEVVSGCGAVAYLGEIPLDDRFEYRGLVTDAAAEMTFNVNWLTHIANAYAYTSYIDTTDDMVDNPDVSKPGIYTRYRIDLANKQVSALFGIPDITSTQPIAPSQIHKNPSLNLALQEQGILLGAILSSAQLLKPADQSLVSFFNGMIAEFNGQRGAWLQKDNDPNVVSLFDIYQAAETVLRDNIAFLLSQNVVVPAIASSVADELQRRQQALQQGEYLGPIDVTLGDSAQAEYDKIAEAKTFIQDLNDRFLNFTGKDTGKPSFVDRDYVARINQYTDDVNVALQATSPDLMLAFATLRNAVEYYASALNGRPDGNNPLALAGRVELLENIKLPDNEGIEDATGESDKLKVSSGDQTLYLSFLGNDNTPRKPTDGSFYLFRFYIEGTLVEGNTRFDFNVGTNSDGILDKAYIEIEYEPEFVKPVEFSIEEPLTYQISWPVVKSVKQGGSQSFDITQLFEAELAGIADPLIADSEFRYNAKAIRYRLLTEGDILGQRQVDGEEENIRDGAEGIVTLSSSGWSLYYPETKWPDLSQFLQFRDGYDTVTIEDNVFEYRVANETIEGVSVQYLDLIQLASDLSPVAAERFRFYPDSAIADQFEVERCELDISDVNAPLVSACDARVRRQADLEEGQAVTIEHLAQKLSADYVDIAGRGVYQPKFSINADNSVATLVTDVRTRIAGRVVRLLPDLFEYQTGEETVATGDGNSEQIEFLEVAILDESQQPSIIQRYRQYPIAGETEKYNLERCSVQLKERDIINGNGEVIGSETVREVGSCDAKTEIAGEPNLDSLSEALFTLSFLVPTRGSYQIQLPTEIVVEDGKEAIKPLPLLRDQVVRRAGVLTSPITLGFDLITVRLAAELFDPVTDGDPEEVGPLIIDAKFKVLAEDVYDVSLMFGYDYQYLIDIVPTGENAQSFYIAYQAGFGEQAAPEELGSFLIFRGGVSINGADAQSIGVFATSVAEYQLTEADTGITACGAVNRDYNVVSCDILAYLGYKGSLLAIVREERDDVHVARFINGEFILLGQ